MILAHHPPVTGRLPTRLGRRPRYVSPPCAEMTAARLRGGGGGDGWWSADLTDTYHDCTPSVGDTPRRPGVARGNRLGDGEGGVQVRKGVN